MITVNLLEFFPFAWIMHLARALITFNVVFTVLKSKYNTAITFFALVIPSLIYSGITIVLNPLNHETLAMYFYYVLQFIICCIVTEGKIFSKLFSIIFSLVTYLGGALTFSALRVFDASVVFSYQLPLSEFLLEVVCIYSFSFISVALIKLIQNKTQSSLQYGNKLVFLFIFPVTHLLCIYGVFSMILSLSQEQREIFYQSHFLAETVMIVCCVLCVVIDFAMLFVADHIEKVEEKNIKAEKELLKNKLDYQQMMMIKEEKQELRKIKHDYANILTTAKGFIEIGKPEKALSILQSTNNDLSGISGFSLCSNETINTIIYIKQQQAKSSNVILDAKIDEAFPVNIDDYDLCRIINNIIDNSINAVLKLNDERISKVLISIDKDMIAIKSENRYKEEKQHRNRKTDEHGNGIGIIKEISLKYKGKYTATQNGDIYCTETILKNSASDIIA